MHSLRRLKLLVSQEKQTLLLLLEAYYYLGYARLLIRSMPFSKIAPKLGECMQETQRDKNQAGRIALRRISHAIAIMSRYTPWESKCLVKAIAAMKMLERRQMESTLYLGTAKDENSKMIAHAWLRSGRFYVTGAEGMERFTVVSKFAKKFSGFE